MNNIMNSPKISCNVKDNIFNRCTDNLVQIM